jgi:hypothetical protein
MKPDMSPQAVTRRLRQTSELRRLCLALGKGRLRSKLKPTIRPPEGKKKQQASPTGS